MPRRKSPASQANRLNKALRNTHLGRGQSLSKQRSRAQRGHNALNTGAVAQSRHESGKTVANTGFVGLSRERSGRSALNTGIVDLVNNRQQGPSETGKKQPQAAYGEGEQPLSKTAEGKELTRIRGRYTRAAARNERSAERAEQAGDTERAKSLRTAAQVARNYSESLTLSNIAPTDMPYEDRVKALGRTVAEERIASMYQNAKLVSDDTEYANRLASTILNNGRGGAFYAATIDMWRGVKGDARNEKIVSAFQELGYNVTSLLDVMQILQDETGIDFLSPNTVQSATEKYMEDSVRSMRVVRRLAREGRKRGQAA